MNKKVMIFVTCFIFVMFYSNGPFRLYNKEDGNTNVELDNSDPMGKTLARIKGIRELCGDLCDTTKKIKPANFIGSVTAKVDCNTLFQSPVLYQPGDLPPQSWGQLPHELQDMYTYGGRVDVHEWFLNDASTGEGRNEATIFTKEDVEYYIKTALDGTPTGWYTNGTNIVAAAADHIDVAGKTILVIGSQSPRLEAVLLHRKPKKVVTLEYGYFISEYPGYSFMRPREFRERYLNGTLDKFDVVFTYSSLEHSGLGRYGDPLNPWGDIMAVAEAWCVSTKGAVLAMGVPTMVSRGKDINVFNAHKIYGPLMYPFLTTNWKFVWPNQDQDRDTPGSVIDEDAWTFQPIYIFEKDNGGL